MKPPTCQSCPLWTSGAGWVPGTPSPASLLVVGEAPGEYEARLGQCFVGRSGQFLDTLLGMLRIPRTALGFHNVLSCRPPGNALRGESYFRDAVTACGRHLEASIARIQPKVLLALGETALERLTGQTGIQKLRGYLLTGPLGLPVIPTLHPAYLLPGRTRDQLRTDRPSRFMGLVLLDLAKAWALAQDPAPVRRRPQQYLLDPDPETFAVWARDYQATLQRDPETILTWDIETPGKRLSEVPMLEQAIIRIGFAYQAGSAVTVPWTPAVLPTIRTLLDTPGLSTGWNSWAFDNAILRFHLPGWVPRAHRDMMRDFHVLHSDVPKSLETAGSIFTDLAPWKDLADADPARYNATDCDAQIRASYGIRAQLQDRGLWTMSQRLIQDLAPLLQEAGARGLLIDRPAQQALEAQLEAELKRLLVDAQTQVDPAADYAAKTYVRMPKTGLYEEVTEPKEVLVCDLCGKEKPAGSHYLPTKTRPACMGRPRPVIQPLVRYRRLMELREEQTLQEMQDEIASAGYNPLSLKALAAYANRFRHLELLGLQNLDDTALGQLEKRFGASHPIYRTTRQIREKTKELSTYLYAYRPDATGRIHTTYNDNPSTLRLGSQDVNTQNVPLRIKGTIIPPSGWDIVAVDSSAIEAVLTGYCAQDPEYIRLAARGIHDFVNCMAHGIPFDEEGIRRSKTEFAATRKVKKMTVHLSNYGGTPRMMRMQAPEVYRSDGDAELEQRFYFSACPSIKAWHRRTRALVARTRQLVNAWGFIQEFYEVFDGDQPGSDYNRCLGAGPQSLAACFMRENLWRLGQSEWRAYMWANCTTHDELALIVPMAQRDAAQDYLEQLMTRPIPELDSLRIGCESKVAHGKSWADLVVVNRIEFPDPLERSTWPRAVAALSDKSVAPSVDGFLPGGPS